MRFDMGRRTGYVVKAHLTNASVTEPDAIHVITVDDAEDVGLRHGDEVELAFPGSGFREGSVQTGTVIGVVADVNP